MIRRVLFVVFVGAVAGYLVHLARGALVGTAVAIVVAVLGLLVLTLRRNQRDLKALEQRQRATDEEVEEEVKPRREN